MVTLWLPGRESLSGVTRGQRLPCDQNGARRDLCRDKARGLSLWNGLAGRDVPDLFDAAHVDIRPGFRRRTACASPAIRCNALVSLLPRYARPTLD